MRFNQSFLKIIKRGRLCEKPAAFLFKQENHRQCRWLQKGFAGKRNDFRNKTFEKRCGATPRKKRPQKCKTSVFQIKTLQICVIARPQRGRGNLKVKGMASRNEAREHEVRGNPYREKHDLLRRFASSFFLSRFCSFQGSVSFRSTIFRSGMTNRIVKDCRVGRTRSPRNDRKLAGFMKKPASF